MSGQKHGGKQRRKPRPAAEVVVPMRQGRHGGLLRTGNPGNKGGPGNPPSIIRQRLTGSLEQRIPLIEEFADARVKLRTRCEKCGHTPEATAVDSQQPSHADRLRALDLMGKYGPGTTSTVNLDDVTGRLEEQYRVLMEELDPKVFETVSKRLDEVWR